MEIFQSTACTRRTAFSKQFVDKILIKRKEENTCELKQKLKNMQTLEQMRYIRYRLGVLNFDFLQ